MASSTSSPRWARPSAQTCWRSRCQAGRTRRRCGKGSDEGPDARPLPAYPCRDRPTPAMVRLHLRGWIMDGVRRAPPVWLMGFCQAPLGVSGGLLLITLPQLLAARHVPEPVIAEVETWYLVPSFCAFLLSPLLDWRFTRRFYAIVFAVLTAAAMFAAYLTLDNIALLSQFAFWTGAAITLYVAAIGGWTGSIVEPEKKASLGAWMTVANIGTGGLTVAVAIVLLRHLPFVLGDAILALFGILPLALFPFMPVVAPDKKLASESFRDFFRDVVNLLRKPSVRFMLLFFALPSASFSL